jgi:small subunit ribosomal protein S10
MKSQQKIRLTLRSYDHRLLDDAVKRLVATVLRTGSVMVGPVPLPNHERFITVNTSPHVDKRAREQYSLVTHTRYIEIEDPSEVTMDGLMKLNIAAGVDVEIKSGRKRA